MIERSLINEKWLLGKKISKGTFGEIFYCRNILNNKQLAIKLQTEIGSLKWEGEVLKSLNGNIHVPEFIYMNEINDKDYIIMELLGEDMGILRQISRQNIQKNGYLIQLPIAIHLAKEMINCIEYVHNKGYIHRDVKPANFVQRLDLPETYCIVDFGIAKLNVDRETGQIRPERPTAEFRGTTMYASLNTHEDKDQSFRDDLWSIIFSFVDILVGLLPWSEEGKKKEKRLVTDIKRDFITTSDKFSNWIQEQILTTENTRVSTTQPIKISESNMSWNYFNDIINHLNSLSYSDIPDYNLIRSLLDQIFNPNGIEKTFTIVEIFQLLNLYNVKTNEKKDLTWLSNDLDFNNNDYSSEVKQEVILHYCNKILKDYDSRYRNYILKLIQSKKLREISERYEDLLIIYRVCIIFIKLILQLQESEIEQQTIQILSKVISNFYSFYYFGYITSMNESITDEGSKQDIGITWIEFCQSQQLIFQFSQLVLKLKQLSDEADGEIISFSSQQKLKKRTFSG